MLTAISPIDGRYRSKVAELADYFSEFALIKYRVFIEIEYFIALVNIPLPQLSKFDKTAFEELRGLYKNFTAEDAQTIKDFEKQTNHDVKAVEYYLKDKFDQLKIGAYKEFIHFGLTSQDINNTAVPYSLKLALNEVYLPILGEVINKLEKLSLEWRNIPMLAHTHGQPASPTKLGKEISVFVERLKIQKKQLVSIPYAAKFGGANGNFNAHLVAYPQIDWAAFGDNMVNIVLTLHRSQTTTQIEHYDNLAAQLDAMKRINNILINLDRDVWTYISMEYFKQKITKGETGSSTKIGRAHV